MKTIRVRIAVAVSKATGKWAAVGEAGQTDSLSLDEAASMATIDDGVEDDDECHEVFIEADVPIPEVIKGQIVTP